MEHCTFHLRIEQLKMFIMGKRLVTLIVKNGHRTFQEPNPPENLI